MKKMLLPLLLISLIALAGCSVTEEVKMSSYTSISQDEAKKIMDEQSDYVVVDSRTVEEFEEGHIEGAILIPEYDIANQADEKLPDKDQLILVYCRSGRRSKIASQTLVQMGYTNVKEFGGIMDWQYEIVK